MAVLRGADVGSTSWISASPRKLDTYAEAVALVGDGSFLLGDAVLAMHGLALVNPMKLRVGTPERIRKSLPEWVAPVTVKGKATTRYEGISSRPSQGQSSTASGA